MKQFHYTAVDAQGVPVSGAIDAPHWSAALEQLNARGLVDCRQTGVAELPVLSASDAVELAGYLAELSKSGLPLGGMLRALVQDASSPALRRVIDQLTVRMEAGQPLDAALESLGGSLPEHIRRLLVTAARAGQLSQALERLLAHEHKINDMGRRLRQVVAYPLLLLAILVCWLLFMSVEILPEIVSALTDSTGNDSFAVHSEDNLIVTLAAVSAWLPIVFSIGLAAIAQLVLLVWLVRGRAGLSRLLSWIPLIGPCWSARGLADFSGLLSELVGAQLTLPEALELTGGGARDPALRRAALAAARQTRQGTGLSAALHQLRVFPDTLGQWADWGQRRGALAGGLRTASQMFTERFELRLQFLRMVLPAFVFVLIAASALLISGAVFQSLFALVSYLTWDSPSTGTPFTFEHWLVGASLLAAFLVGLLLFLLARLARGGGDVEDVLAVVARYVGATMVAVALLALFVVISWYGVIAWLVLMVAWIRVALRHRQMQKQALWTTLSLAAEQGAPLAPMAWAFADEQSGLISLSARELAQQLAAGADLATASAWCKRALPADAPLVVRVGMDLGDLHGALLAARGASGSARPLMPASVIWLLLFLPAALLCITFMQVKIMPSFVRIFDDFSTELPPLTRMLIDGSSASYLPLVLLVVVGLTLFVWLQWRGTLQPRLPGMKRILRWIEFAPLLRILALVTQRGQPLAASLESMARLHPRAWVRRRLRKTVRDVQLGSTWQASLRRHRLLGDGDLAVLAAAERNGNLPWALSEMGESMQRRADFQLRVFGEFAFPLLLTLVGLTVALLAVAYFLPLVNLIIGLT
jgi:general secretion pathway protein F